jgi:hypothetical protein
MQLNPDVHTTYAMIRTHNAVYPPDNSTFWARQTITDSCGRTVSIEKTFRYGYTHSFSNQAVEVNPDTCTVTFKANHKHELINLDTNKVIVDTIRLYGWGPFHTRINLMVQLVGGREIYEHDKIITMLNNGDVVLELTGSNIAREELEGPITLTVTNIGAFTANIPNTTLSTTFTPDPEILAHPCFEPTLTCDNLSTYLTTSGNYVSTDNTTGEMFFEITFDWDPIISLAKKEDFFQGFSTMLVGDQAGNSAYVTQQQMENERDNWINGNPFPLVISSDTALGSLTATDIQSLHSQTLSFHFRASTESGNCTQLVSFAIPVGSYPEPPEPVQVTLSIDKPDPAVDIVGSNVHHLATINATITGPYTSVRWWWSPQHPGTGISGDRWDPQTTINDAMWPTLSDFQAGGGTVSHSISEQLMPNTLYTLELEVIDSASGQQVITTASYMPTDMPPILDPPGTVVAKWRTNDQVLNISGVDPTVFTIWTNTRRPLDPEEGTELFNSFQWQDQTNNPYTIILASGADPADPMVAKYNLDPNNSITFSSFFQTRRDWGITGTHRIIQLTRDSAGQEDTGFIDVDFDSAPPVPP